MHKHVRELFLFLSALTVKRKKLLGSYLGGVVAFIKTSHLCRDMDSLRIHLLSHGEISQSLSSLVECTVVIDILRLAVTLPLQPKPLLTTPETSLSVVLLEDIVTE